MRGDPPKQNYLPEGGPLVVQASPACWVFQEPTCVSAAAGVVRGCIWLQCIFFVDTMCLPISWWEIGDQTCPLHTECPVVFDQKRDDPNAPPSQFTWSHPKWLFLFPQWKKSSKGNVFVDMEEVRQNTAETPTGIKIDDFRNRFEQWKKCLG